MTKEQIRQIVRLTEAIVSRKLNEIEDPETWIDSDYGRLKSVTRNKRNKNQAKLVTNHYPDGIYLEKDRIWDTWVEIDKPSNFTESVSRIPNKNLNEDSDDEMMDTAESGYNKNLWSAQSGIRNVMNDLRKVIANHDVFDSDTKTKLKLAIKILDDANAKLDKKYR